jgi:acetoin utilization deacetylase AcuC-like enzyme
VKPSAEKGAMELFFDPRQLLHAPERELHNGDWTPYVETPARALAIVEGVAGWKAPTDHGIEPILAVHDPAYVAFLRQAHAEWRAAGRSGDAIGYTFPVVGRRPLALDRIDAKLGAYSFDAATPIAEGTWEAAYWSAQCALSAIPAPGGNRFGFALCRPPGHHAGSDYMGGYCYLNNAAITARHAQSLGYGRVAILDIDYHHGNGTQDIFRADPSVFFCSIHADPRTDYPFFWGQADECGIGPGKRATLNFPLPRGTGRAAYVLVLARALEAIAQWRPDLLVVSFGADTHGNDPISFFELGQADYTAIARRIAGLGLPVLVVMEGGYALGELAASVAALIEGFDGGKRGQRG